MRKSDLYLFLRFSRLYAYTTIAVLGLRTNIKAVLSTSTLQQVTIGHWDWIISPGHYC